MNPDHCDIGAIQYRDEPIELHPGRKRTTIRVRHCGDRPIQVGSHFHFFEVNKALEFDRKEAYGMHLDVLSGTAIRFEPGEEKKIQLVAYGGRERMIGFNGLTMGDLKDIEVSKAAFERARSKGYVKNEQGDREGGQGGSYAD